MRDNGEDKRKNELLIITKSNNLVDYTLNITDNYNNFPKKVRFSFVNRIQDCVLNIHLSIVQYCNTKGKENLDKVKIECINLLTLIELSFRRKYINSNTCAYWGNLVKEVQNLLGV